MSSFSSPRGSPRYDPRRRRRHQPLARSTSIFGALKNLVTAPFSWLGVNTDFEDTPGKRRRNPQPAASESSEQETSEPRSKRKRIYSPEVSPPPAQRPQASFQQEESAVGYLDPPENLIGEIAAPRTRLTGHGRSSSLAVPSQRQPDPYNRHSHSPTASTSYARPVGIVRTQSMDPPAVLGMSSSRGAVQTLGALSRDVSMESAYQPYGRDATLSPSRSSFRLRTSLTPQPTGQVFGPTPHQRTRDPSEPPPLTSLMSNPVFVKPPQIKQQPQLLVHQPTVTLGILAEEQRRDGSPMRQHSTLLLNKSGSSSDMAISSATSHRPINAAERALHDLDVYKTPLLPSRLRGSTTIPDMFKPKRLPTPVLMTKRQDDKPRLGMSDKQKGRDAEQESAGVKPYAGRGGMKKLLARRRQEEEEEREEERETTIQTDQGEEEDEDMEKDIGRENIPRGKAGVKPTESQVPAVLPLAVPDFASIPSTGRATSLRVGRNTTNRKHISHPFARPKNRFSARYDDDESDESMSTSQASPTSEDVVKAVPPPLFQVPAGFSFAKDSAPIKHDTSDAKEPPIASLPFSLSKSTTPSTSAAPSPSQIPVEEPRKPPTSVFAQLSRSSPSAPPAADTAPSAESTLASAAATTLVPSISLTPATPRPPSPAANSAPAQSAAPNTAAPTVSASPAVPNFFANSSIFSKPGVTITPPAPTPSITSAPAQDREKVQSSGVKEDSAPVPAFQFPQTSTFGSGSSTTIGNTEAKTAPSSTSLFGNAPSTAPSFLGGSNGTSKSLFSASATPAKEPSGPTLAPSLFVDTSVKTSAPATSAFSFGPPAKTTEQPDVSAKSFTFGEPAKAPEAPAASASQPFSFNAPAKPAEPVAPSPFSFAAPKPAETKEVEQKSSLQPSLFPNTPAVTPAFTGFGAAAASGTSTEAPKTGFTFGRPATSSATSTSTIQSPKPLFGGDTSSGFSFARPSSSPAAEAPTPVKSPFTFGAAPTTPPVTSGEKPAFSFGAPAPTASSGAGPMLFGAPGGGSNGADVSSKPFAFPTASTPTRSITPPRTDQEVLMDESPVRGGGMNMNGNGKEEAPKPSGGFSFGAPSASGTSLFGQASQRTSSPFSFGGAPASGPFGAKPEAAPEVKPASTFRGFGSSPSTGFGGFGQRAPESTQSPLSPSPFASSAPFGQPTPPTTTSTFAFGGQSGGSNAFGQAAASGPSAPASPSTFGAPGAFSFGTPTSATAPPNPFGFGSSQPVSPAGGNAGLPQSATATNPPFSFGSSPATPQAPASPFGAPAAPLPPTGGGTLFTMGAAPAPAPQQRTIKKLPTRRGGKR
ncbi:hypothetical protein B0H21DRAFT_817923 [Amylocystis lapponica]|nr:hypothetical protein B0H21DRAFT_817923 [Amylocystis lapponica]